LQQLPQFEHPSLLVSGATYDDAGVYRLDPEKAAVLTIDVLTPVADDPYTFGQIAAANGLSDVYAMGGRPLVVLCYLGYPVNELAPQQAQAILAGVWDKVAEADAVVIGGHTTKDMEVKCGVAVMGLVHPQKVVTNAAAQPGDRLILTKPLGLGIITTALRANLAPAAAVVRANQVMTRLNRPAAEAMIAVGVNAATDVTGFGLLGHAWEMAQASKVELVIEADRVPIIPEAHELAGQSLFPEGSVKNYGFMKSRADFSSSIGEGLRLLLCDAQTSGGLLISVARERSAELLDRLHAAGVNDAAVIGHVAAGAGRLRVE